MPATEFSAQNKARGCEVIAAAVGSALFTVLRFPQISGYMALNLHNRQRQTGWKD